MGHILIRRTWPCGMQESIDARGIWIQGAEEDDKPRNCPQHGAGPCYKGAGA